MLARTFAALSCHCCCIHSMHQMTHLLPEKLSSQFQKDLDEQATITENSPLNYSQRVQLSAAASSETYENRWLQNKSSFGYSSKSYTKQALCLFNRPGNIHDPFGKNSGHVSISCEGVCEVWPHWCCAGLSKATFHHYVQSRPWVFPTLGVSKARLSMLYTYTLQAH